MADLTYRLFIDGQWQDSDGPSTLEVLNPATEEIVGVVPEATRSDVQRAIRAARAAFDDGPWPRMSARERSVIMLRMADAMERRAEEIKALSAAEAGSVRWLQDSIQVTLPIQHFRDMAERILPSYKFERAAESTTVGLLTAGVIRREAYGVAALISAYNFPFFLNIMKLAPALAAGCTVVLKPAPTTPLEAFFLGEIAEEAGLPAGVLNIVTGDVEAGQELTTHPDVDLISFTGSDTVGRLVYGQAAPTLKKVVLELGGKSANIILDDADLAGVVQSVVGNMVTHAGQGCALLTRTLVHESKYDELVGMVKYGLDQVKVGDPSDPTVMMGPLISAAQRDKVEALIKAGLDEGAQLAYGGGRPHGLEKGFFVEPTLFVGVENTMTIAQKEFFGPVGVIIPFKDDQDAVRLANESDFGLGGGVWSGDPARAYAVATQIRTGFISINGGGSGVTPFQPFGGYKQSGLGREWGEFGLEEYLQTKSIAWNAR
ncbi:aldehyde dehydrogenase family protein [Nocardioides sp. Iso805N]|uniref:aldehyde dehydrogenase family protein n=1 Tax=Nocardioides sp. Iso805N TaxID=1283287 RepID=UPI00036EF140|nr:aldehyde dehydrogenase family protein [Nocardioides sp. Iso805N]